MYNKYRCNNNFFSTIAVVILTLIAAAATLIRLDDALLWQDEAETAVLGRNILTYGLPRADDGRSTVLDGGHEYDASTKLWIFQTWIQYYLCAFSMKLFGVTTFAARLPFALLGIACIPLTYCLTRYLTGRAGVSLLAALFLTTSVPFILLSRQARYYSPSTLGTLVLLYGYVRVLRRDKYGAVVLLAGATFLYYSMILSFFGVMLGIAIHYLLFERLAQFRKMVGLLVAMATVTLPWFIYSGGFSRPGQIRPMMILPNLIKFVFWINNYMYPVVMLLIPLGFFLWHRLRRTRRTEVAVLPHPHAVQLLVVVIAACVLMFSPVFWVYFRYLAICIPLLAIVLAATVYPVWTACKPVGFVIIAILIGSNLFNLIPVRVFARPLVKHTQRLAKTLQVNGQTRDNYFSIAGVAYRRYYFDSLPVQYWRELTTSYRGPLEATVDYLNAHAKEGDRVWTTYEGIPLIFYTECSVISYYHAAQQPNSFWDADWVIPRPFKGFVSFQGGNHPAVQLPPNRSTHPELRAKFDRLFEPIPLGIPNLKSENRPAPDLHLFVSPTNNNELVLYRKRQQ